MNVLKFEEQELNPDPGHKQKNHHLRESVTKPSGKAKSSALGKEAEIRKILLVLYCEKLERETRTTEIKILRSSITSYCFIFRQLRITVTYCSSVYVATVVVIVGDSFFFFFFFFAFFV